MQQTQYYGFLKPEATDDISPEPFNSNADTIDQAIHDLSENKQNALSASQLNAVNSGMTTAKRQKLDALPTATELNTAINGKQDTLSSAQLNAVNSGITSAKVTKLDVLPTNATLNTNLSAKAAKVDITDISVTGSTNNTGSTITAGTLFYKDGTLCKALTDIANGVTLTNGSNYTGFYVNNFVKHIISVEKTNFTLPTNYTEITSIVIPPHSCYAINGFAYAQTGRTTGIYIDYTGNTSTQSGAVAIREDINGVFGVSYCGYNYKNYSIRLCLVAKGDSNTTINAGFNGWYEYTD